MFCRKIGKAIDKVDCAFEIFNQSKTVLTFQGFKNSAGFLAFSFVSSCVKFQTSHSKF